MRTIFRDFKDAALAWGGVLLVLTVAQSMLGMLAVMLSSADAMKRRPGMAVAANTTYENLLIPFIAMLVATVLVVLQVVSSVIMQRRRNLALLALQGATPWQLTRMTCVRVLALTVVASLVSLIVSGLLVRPLYAWETAQFEIGRQPFFPGHELQAWGIGIGCGFVVALAGTLPTVRAASGIAPVEALRAAMNPPKRIGWARRILSLVLLAAAVLIMIVPVLRAQSVPHARLATLDSAEPILSIGEASTFGFLVLLVSICMAGPELLGWVTLAWTRLVAFRSPSWRIACQQAAVRARGLSATMIPLTVGVALLMMTDSFYLTSQASSRLLPPNLEVDGSNFSMLLTLLGPALVVVLAGVCAGYLILARGRSLDLVLVSVAGAEPRQLSLMAGFEGIITATTTVLISFIASLLPLITYVAGFKRVFGASRLSLPWAHWVLVYVVLALAGALASWLTVRRSAHASPVGVLSRYTGE